MYDNKYINQDFISTNNTHALENFITGKYGSVPTSVGYIGSNFFQTLRDQGADLYVPTVFETDDGQRATANALGFWGMYMISKQAVPDEERLLEILAFFDRTMEQDITDLIAIGEEGVHHEYVDGKFQWIDQPQHLNDTIGTGSI